jgi:hypothetical protein
MPIEVSSDHLILLDFKHWVPAGTVKVGDVLTKGDGSPAEIIQLQHVTSEGIFAPFTRSGSIVVNDIVASNYVTFQESEYLIIGGVVTPLSFHWLAHTFESAHRLACTIIACHEEAYTDSGICAVGTHSTHLWHDAVGSESRGDCFGCFLVHRSLRGVVVSGAVGYDMCCTCFVALAFFHSFREIRKQEKLLKSDEICNHYFEGHNYE